ncbi:MAG: LapA family protein [Bacillota bacterium]|jgi:uncharacterized integral membrane protein
MQLKVLLFIVLALVVVAFSLLNPQAVVVNFGFWSAPSVPLAAVIIASVAIGALTMVLIGLGNQLRQALKMRELTRRLEQATKELQKQTERANLLDRRLEELLAAVSEEAGKLPTGQDDSAPPPAKYPREGAVQGGN